MPAWKPGESGNPRGPAKGSGPVQKLRKAIEKDLPGIIDAMVTAAKAGDPAAAKLLLDKVLPSIRPESRPVPAGVHLDPEAIIAAVERGILTQDQARDLMDLILTRAKIGEAGETAERLTRIESLLTGK